MGLKTRLNHYLSQNAAVPLIMNCQVSYRSLEYRKIYNQEVIFSMDEQEGVGIFCFGVGKHA